MTQFADRILLPVENLKVPAPWPVGAATIYPGETAHELIDATPPLDSDRGFVRARVNEILESASTGSIIEVPSKDHIDDAIAQARESLSLLRLFQTARATTHQTAFGLPGDLYSATFRYIAIADRSAHGGRHLGHFAGWGFDQSALDDWTSSGVFQYLSRSLADPSDEGAARAVRGALIFDRADLEHRPDLKMIGFTSAFEAWLLRRSPGAQTMRLARHVTFFGCGAHDDDQCGRSRPTCPYLHLRPDAAVDRRRLSTLRDLGNDYPTWRCSEWHRVMDWYDSRSSVAHGGYGAVDADEASRAGYWISHYLLEPIVTWLRDHPDDPVGQLENRLDEVADPVNWVEMINALDQDEPPDAPPWPPA